MSCEYCVLLHIHWRLKKPIDVNITSFHTIETVPRYCMKCGNSVEKVQPLELEEVIRLPPETIVNMLLLESELYGLHCQTRLPEEIRKGIYIYDGWRQLLDYGKTWIAYPYKSKE